ncbi:hypothetical protein Maes01_02305 [Microbulbifer aestuariivivens]|uniref:Uncharacterized protein n=1 Tax=Microbulbifer aestuariivivens TaxID=1908308 RepID=A0ABP9WT01_9GAMM
MVQIEIVLKGKDFPEVYKLWDKLTKEVEAQYIDKQVIDGFSGKELGFADVSETLLKSKADSFFIELNGGSVEFSYIADLDFSRLDIKNLATTKESAEQWVSQIVNEPDFVQGRLYDGEYDRWQNMEDIAYYESEGRDHSSLSKKSNGLPFPLESEVIDISMNPGRWELKKGYIECVGSTMWMSKALLEDLGVDNFSIERVTDLGSVLKFDVLDDCFKESIGEEAEAQNVLRKMLFNK